MGHSFVEDKSLTYLKEPATCTSVAIYYHKCANCGAKGTSTFKGQTSSHKYTAKDTSATYLKSPATCTSEEVYYYKCETCTAKGKDTFILYGTKLSHDYGEWKTTKPATCGEDGEERQYCRRDGCEEYAWRPIRAQGHSYGEWEVVTAATCVDEGSRVQKCSICGNLNWGTIEIDFTNGHNMEETGKWVSLGRSDEHAKGIRCTRERLYV